ncbi:YkvI family membrane protein [Marinicrinis sediminis]|uniref:Transporter n=1 Tax=Marinicrinis sediminis TaxID=1652465 RepID=A0ABW5R6E5_9BACL
MKRLGIMLQIACTYIGTIVGAGFATGQEILQFFTRYGKYGSITILLSTWLFIWLGTKLMLTAQTMKAHSYADLNRMLFGPSVGRIVSLLLMLVLFGISSVMLAGAGSVFEEHFGWPYQAGLGLTLLLGFLILSRGMQAIFAVNSIVVPCMLLYLIIIVVQVSHSPTAGNWLTLDSDASPFRIWMSPFLYAAFNLALAQAVLVPIGGKMEDAAVIRGGGIIGGIGVGLMLLALHMSLSSKMPDIASYEIPMGQMATQVVHTVQLLFILIIFSEIFTTFIADLFGLMTQLETKVPWGRQTLLVILLAGCYAISQVGFSSLVAFLYPLFGMLSSFWLTALILKRT